MIGLDVGSETAILHVMKLGDVATTLTVWSVGGHHKVRFQWNPSRKKPLFPLEKNPSVYDTHTKPFCVHSKITLPCTTLKNP